MPWGEVPTTHLLAFFLNPAEEHGQGALFQTLFIEHLQRLPLLSAQLPQTHWRIEAERRHGKVGQIDLLLLAPNNSFAVCLENKPRDQTIDQDQQLIRYQRYLKERCGENYLLLYLSREGRHPHPSSLPEEEREQLTASGHYVNLTYSKFLLPLLDAWHQAIYPESLRTFLRQFRYHIEQWLNFPTTKPARLMQEQEITKTLLSNPTHLQTAFDIAQALETTKRQLREKLMQELPSARADLVGQLHWQWNGFLAGRNREPFLIVRTATSSPSAQLPWDRYAIGFELENGRLCYGIRFAITKWTPTDTSNATGSTGAADMFTQSLGVGEKPNPWWPWWTWVDAQTDATLYSAIADNSLLAFLQTEVSRIAQALNKYCLWEAKDD